MANNLMFDNLSFKNRLRCGRDYKQDPDTWNVLDIFNRTEEEWNELNEEIEALKYKVKMIDTDTEPNRLAIIDEACDVIIMLDLLIQRLGARPSLAIARKFNRTSDKIGSQIKIPV
jgi:hypothetical protein